MKAEPFANKKFTPSEINGMRNSLVEKYGKRIVLGSIDSMSPEEQMACEVYMVLSDSLHKIVPKTVNPDKAINFYVRNNLNTIFDFLIPFRMTKRKPNTTSGKIIVSLWLITQIFIVVYSLFGIGSVLVSFLNPSTPLPEGPLSFLAIVISLPFFWLLGAISNNFITGIVVVLVYFTSYYVIPIIIAEMIFSTFYKVWSGEKIMKHSNVKFSKQEIVDFLNNLEQSYLKSKVTK